MANMLRANEAIRSVHRARGPAAYGECTRCFTAIDGCHAFVSAGPIGTVESVQCQFCHCHRNVHRRLDIDDHQSPAESTQQQVYSAPIATQGYEKMEESTNTNNANHLGYINTQMYNSPGVTMEMAEYSVMARATQRWADINKKDGGNKRKKSWDELVAEEYEEEQPEILANQLEWTLNVRSENGKNKKIKKNEKEKKDGFEMYLKNKSEAIRKLGLAQAGESTSSGNHNCPN